MSRAFPGDATDYAKQSRKRIAARLEEGRCSSCGGRWWAAGKRYWHKASCASFKQSPADQDRDAAALRDLRAPVLARECGCEPGQHDKYRCTGFFDAYPAAEVGEEYVNQVEGP